MLQKLPECSIKAVLKLYNQIWVNDGLPVSWRHSIVLPVLKPGKDQLNPASYRPISLTPTLCKLRGKLVTNRLTYFVENNNILNNIHCGFRKNHSTIDHIITVCTVVQNCCKGRSKKYIKWHCSGCFRRKTP